MGAAWSAMAFLKRRLSLKTDDTAISVSASGEASDVDPATGLSRLDKEHVRQSWQSVRQDLKAAGLGFFQAFFKAHPEYQLYFKAFSDVPLDQLAHHPRFNAHAMYVMNAICMVVDSLDNPASLVVELKKLGQSHARRKLQIKHFRNLSVVLIGYLEAALGPQNFNEPVKKSWIKALDVVVNVISSELKSDGVGE